MARHEFELKGKTRGNRQRNNNYQVHWEKRRVGNVQRKVLVIDEVKKKGGSAMNKQKQIEKMAEIMCKDPVGCEFCNHCFRGEFDCIEYMFAENAVEAGYINGADFVEWLKSRVISNRDYPHLAVALLCDDMREELSEFIDKALQEYLKGE